jgi:hypothetical protein
MTHVLSYVLHTKKIYGENVCTNIITLLLSFLSSLTRYSQTASIVYVIEGSENLLFWFFLLFSPLFFYTSRYRQSSMFRLHTFIPSFSGSSLVSTLCLYQCFPNGIPRNPTVPRSENKGSARKFQKSIKNHNLNIITNFN